MKKNKECLNCKNGAYWKQQQVICFIYDDLMLETDYCGLWSDKND